MTLQQIFERERERERDRQRERERQRETERERERDRTNESKIAYNKQRNACVSLLHKTRKGYFNLDTKIVKDNRKFGKTVNSLFLEKSYSKESNCLMQKSRASN